MTEINQEDEAMHISSMSVPAGVTSRVTTVTSSRLFPLLGLAAVLFILQACAQRAGAIDEAAGDREAMRIKLGEVVAAYEAEDLNLIERSLDPAMIGYQRLVESLRTELDRYGQIRVTLTDTQATASGAGGVINTRFEKRLVRSADSLPGLVAGRTTIVFRKQGREWTIAAIGGDNPFGALPSQ